MSAALTLNPAADVVVFSDPLELHRGGTLADVAVGYERIGRRGGPCVVVLGGITASCHVTAHPDDPSRGWWNELVGPGCALDTRRYQVLSFDFIGGAGASTGPAPDSDPDAFPEVTSHDQAAVLIRLLDRLGIRRLHALVGASFGGMVGLAFAENHGDRIERLVAFGAPDQSRVLSTAWRSIQRQVLRLGHEHGCGDQALALARAIGMTTYRGEDELEQRFGRGEGPDGAPHPAVFPVEHYLEARGRGFVGRFHPAALSVLSRAVDLHRVDPCRIQVPTTVITAASDRLVPPAQLHAMAEHLPRLRRFVCLKSRHGHDAFLKETRRLAPVLRQSLEEGS